MLGMLSDDTACNAATEPLTGDEVLCIFQNDEPRKVTITQFLNAGGGGGDVGTPGSDVTAQELGSANTHVTVLTFTTGAALPAIAGGADLAVGKLVYTLPAGAQVITGSDYSVGITQTAGNINADTPQVALGTTIASGAVAVLTGTAGFYNVGTDSAAANCTGTPTVLASSVNVVSQAGGTKTIYFNAAADWTAGGDPAAELTGTITIFWTQL